MEQGKERYRPPGKLTLELVLANQNKINLCLWTIQLTKWAGKVPYLLLLKCSMCERIYLHLEIVKTFCSDLWITPPSTNDYLGKVDDPGFGLVTSFDSQKRVITGIA